LENVIVTKTPTVVGIVGKGGEVYIDGSRDADKKTIQSWAMGTRYASRNGKPEITHGLVNPAPKKPSNLVDKDGKYFVRSKPDYGNIEKEKWIVVTDRGVKNDGTGDQTDAINKALNSGSLLLPLLSKRYVYFPAGIYQISGTIHVPPGTIIVGSGWSSIRATGDYFKDKNNPKPVVQVGKPGDIGTVEISDMLFTVKGATAGAILVEWNIKAFLQGSAGMWDSHFRIGGSAGSDLSLSNCPQSGGLKDKCVAASLLLHITEKSNGYFENVWAWTADQ
jgi:glucan 1,3-beta-glucosidase